MAKKRAALGDYHSLVPGMGGPPEVPEERVQDKPSSEKRRAADKADEGRTVSETDEAPPTVRTRKNPVTKPKPKARTEPQAIRRKATFSLDVQLMAELRATVDALSGPPRRLKIGQFVERGIRLALDEIYKEEGKPEGFGKRDEPLPPGRRIQV